MRAVLVQEAFGKVGRGMGWVMVNPVGHRRQFGFYSKCDEMPHATVDFKAEVSIVYFLKNQYGQLW